MPSVEATRWAPDLAIKFSSVQLRPESQYSTYSTMKALKLDLDLAINTTTHQEPSV